MNRLSPVATTARFLVSRGSESKTGGKVLSQAGKFLSHPSTRIPIDKQKKKIETAVYGYARAMKTLNRDRISLSEISSALSLTEDEIKNAIKSLAKKGIKLAK